MKPETAAPMDLTEESLERLSSLVMKKMMTKDMFAAARLLVSKGYHVIPGETCRRDQVYWWEQPPFSIEPDQDELRNPFDSLVVYRNLNHLANRHMTKDPTCPPPPNTIPASLADRFTQGGQIPVRYHYYNDRQPLETGVHIDAATYAAVFEQLDNRTFNYYGNEILSFYEALEKYPPAGLSVIIWGLGSCNCDALALWKEAKQVFAVDYNRPACDHPRVASLTVSEMRTANILADYSISYSSFEHDGLGRYGDPIDPDGDLRAMIEAKNSLKNNGLLLLGVPVGPDCLVWNGQRIYGEKRLPLLLKGWQLTDVFHPYKRFSPDYPFDQAIGAEIQPLMVLQKISADYPKRAWLDERLASLEKQTHEPLTSLRDVCLLSRIWRIIRDFAYPGEQ